MGLNEDQFVDGEKLVAKENSELSKPLQEDPRAAKDSRPKKRLFNKKGAHAAEKTIDQTSHQDFINFAESYFQEMNEERFNRVVSPTEIDTKWLDEMLSYEKCYDKHQEVMVRNLTGCLIDQEEISVPDADGNLFYGDEMVGAAVFDGDDGCTFFSQNSVLEAFSTNYIDNLVQMYKRQVAINNSRKEILAKKLRERLVYPAYWAAMRPIDTEVDNVFAKRRRYKKRKIEPDDEPIREILEKHERFTELFSDVAKLEEDYTSYEDLFSLDENVDAKVYGVEPYDYFP